MADGKVDFLESQRQLWYAILTSFLIYLLSRAACLIFTYDFMFYYGSAYTLYLELKLRL